MTQSSADTIGVDISKDFLDANIHPSGEARRFANDAKGHRAFERTVAAAGLPTAKVNPRRFAEATGKLAKTDTIDAATLARFGALLTPPTHKPVSQTLDEMKELHNARTALVKDRVATLNRQKQLRSAILKRLANQRLKQIDSQLKAIDTALAGLRDADPSLKARFDILMSIPGICVATAFALLIEMPEIGNIENPQAASLPGLAPVARDSGNWRGKRSIRGGRANLRQAIYMPALVATRFNPDLKVKYQAMIAAGKPAKVAIVAVMRKLLILAKALLKAGRNWQPKIA